MCKRDAEEFRNQPFAQTSKDGVVQFDSGGASEGNTQSRTSGDGEQNTDSEQHRKNRERMFDWNLKKARTGISRSYIKSERARSRSQRFYFVPLREMDGEADAVSKPLSADPTT